MFCRKLSRLHLVDVEYSFSCQFLFSFVFFILHKHFLSEHLSSNFSQFICFNLNCLFYFSSIQLPQYVLQNASLSSCAMIVQACYLHLHPILSLLQKYVTGVFKNKIQYLIPSNAHTHTKECYKSKLYLVFFIINGTKSFCKNMARQFISN